ncbi:MAG: hydantoinase/oxoprolinase family protein [Azospirillaceae bacterium]
MPGSFGQGARIAADVGGTFTDIAFLTRDRLVASRKVPSTPPDYASGVVGGIVGLLDDLGVPAGSIGTVLHGCTVATNAILEGRGARTALLTTRGFRDVLELRRIRVPKLYDPLWTKPPPLVPRNLRLEVDERLAADGSVVRPLDEADVHAAIDRIRAANVEAVAVCYLHSHVDDRHERRTGEILSAALPDRFITLSCDVLPEIREYERTSTTVINAYVGPVVSAYVRSLAQKLRTAGIDGRLLVMQSSGGMIDADTVVREPVSIVECGPAAGVIGALCFSRGRGVDNIVTLDMGGTTAKASLIEDGRLLRTDEYEVGGSVSVSNQLVKGGGYALKKPLIDISEVGAGGGSIIWLDKAGQMKVGPISAGAVPGPVAYDRGGEDPTLTDANIVLGYLNPDALAGGTVPLAADKARAAIDERIARPLGIDVEIAAYGAHVIANASMIRAVKSVTTHRGRDPRAFTLLAFGGNGGINGVELARAMQIGRVVVPGSAGIFSAVGLLFSGIAVSHATAFMHPLHAIEPEAMAAGFDRIERLVAGRLDRPLEALSVIRQVDLRYSGQAFELTVGVPGGALSRAVVDGLAEAFEVEHERTYGHRFPGTKSVDSVSLRVTATLTGDETGDLAPPMEAGGPAPSEARREAYFGSDTGRVSTPVLTRAGLSDSPREGPLIIEDYDGTVLVPPRARARLDRFANIEIELDIDGNGRRGHA